MDRRRSLLAASQTGGGKVVNHGVLTFDRQSTRPPYIGEYWLTFEYPVDSTMGILVGSVSFSFQVGETSRSFTASEGSHTGDIVFHISGQQYYQSYEDDTYIYEVTINV